MESGPSGRDERDEAERKKGGGVCLDENRGSLLSGSAWGVACFVC